MRNIIFSLLGCFVSFTLSAQTTESKGTLSTTTLVDVKVIKVLPGKKLPQVSLVFRAETQEGDPVWDLKKEDLIVMEDSTRCEILSLDPISKNKPINVGLVLDHSGSMGNDIASLWSIFKLIIGKKDSIIPLEYAKRSAMTFVSSFNTQKDYFSVVAFGSTVDLKIPLNQDTLETNKKIKTIQVNGGTALYDGMIEGMKQLKKAEGIKVLVALTDGMENSSTASWQNVVDYSIQENIPIYIIGLGFVSKDTLNRMAVSTKGQFFHTNKSSSLVDIYQKIGRQIQTFYVVDYKSNRASKATKEEGIKISFEVNSIYLANDTLDPEVVAYLKKNEFDGKLRMYGKVAAYVAVGVGVITLYYTVKRRRKRLKAERAEKIIK